MEQPTRNDTSRPKLEGPARLIRGEGRRARIGLLDHTGPGLGGGQLVVAHIAALLSRDYDVDLIHREGQYELATLAAAFCLNLSQVNDRSIAELNGSFGFTGLRSLFEKRSDKLRNITAPYDLFIYAGHGIPPPCFAKAGLVYCHFPFEPSPLHWLDADPSWRPWRSLSRMMKRSGYSLAWSRRMRGYQKIFANSGFTAAWIERQWGKASEVLYPPVDLDPPLVEKKNLIVSVGRITGERRSKNQLEQVRAFREFARAAGDSWTFRIIGSCGEERRDRDYLTAIEAEATGLPIEVWVNVDRKVALRSLAEAKLFWHTAGLSLDENKHPEHAEHFGIATVEAMRAGCVPVVIASGGQPEIVEQEFSGFLASNLAELIQRSQAVACDEPLMKLTRDRAKRRSMAFSPDRFDQRFTRVVMRSVSL